jgi:predicted ATPase
MNMQLEKIKEFVNTIESSQMTDEQQSLVLSSCVTVIGGSNGSGQCTNYEVSACGGTNKNCTNYNGVCGTSDNRKSCINHPADINP